jgi:hypothetical protein
MLPRFPGIEKVVMMGSPTLKILVAALLALTLGASPALAEIEQCRFIQAKPEREACYARQEAALAAKRKPEPGANTRNADTRMIETLQQMRREDAEVYRSLHGICRGC